MQLVVDASVLVAELLRKAGRQRLAHPQLELFAPQHVWNETQHEYRKRVARLCAQKGLLQSEMTDLLEVGFAAVRATIQVLPHAAYAPLEDEARWRITRDPSDWPSVALGLALSCGVWTNDGDFFGCGLPTWTTTTLAQWLARQQ
jgi:predicted nucleic acid-binding protein